MPKILLVEDNEVNRTMLARRLQQKGFEVLLAETGERGIELAESGRPDLILMDLGLPGIDGHEATRQLKAKTSTCDIPIMALSAHAHATDREKALASGCIDFETKPVQMPVLLSKIEAALERGKNQLKSRTKFNPNDTAEVDLLLAPPEKPPNPASETGIMRRVTMTRVLPPAPQPEPEQVSPTTTQMHPVCSVLRKRILVVEDNDANRVMLRRRLEKQGFEISEAANGREALDATSRETFDLVLLDIMMPEVDGYEVLKELKANPDFQALPIIMISALDETASVARCIEAGAEDYLTKPYDPVLLQARINACLDKRRLRDQELAYLRAVNQLTSAAGGIERGEFEPSSLNEIATRTDELGRLARVFQKMATEVQLRERKLRQEVERLKVEIDEVRKTEQVAEITETAYFQQLQSKAIQLRQRMKRN